MITASTPKGPCSAHMIVHQRAPEESQRALSIAVCRKSCIYPGANDLELRDSSEGMAGITS